MKTFDELCDELLAETNITSATVPQENTSGPTNGQTTPKTPSITQSGSQQPTPTPTPTPANQQTSQLKPEDILKTLHDIADKNPQGLADVLKKINTHNSQQEQQQNYNKTAENAANATN
jgi:hypothetical protein